MSAAPTPLGTGRHRSITGITGTNISAATASTTPFLDPIQQQIHQHDLLKQLNIMNKQLKLLGAQPANSREVYYTLAFRRNCALYSTQLRGIPRNCTFHYAILHLAPNYTLKNYSILHLTPFYTLEFARNCVLGYKALYLTSFYTLLHLRFYLIFVARYCAKLRVKTRKFSQLCAITFFQKKFVI
jgi:hypothetical protein